MITIETNETIKRNTVRAIGIVIDGRLVKMKRMTDGFLYNRVYFFRG